MVISCLGTLNGLIMGSARGMYAMASRDMGPAPGFFKRIDPRTNSTINSALLGLALSALWLVVWYGNFAGWWGAFMDISELPIAFLYVIYIAIYVWVMKGSGDLGAFARFGAPVLAAAGSLYIIWGAIHKVMFIHFLAITAIIIGAGVLMMEGKPGASGEPGTDGGHLSADGRP